MNKEKKGILLSQAAHERRKAIRERLDRNSAARAERMAERQKARQQKRMRDPRITVRDAWYKDYIVLFFVLLCVNGGYMLIYQTVLGIPPTLRNSLVLEPLLFTLFASAILCLVTAALRYSTFNKPMLELGEAARKIAGGDFSVRISPSRKDGKKDYLEVMIDDFNTMAEELSGIETMKNDFIGNVSHELKTPLAVIQNYAGALQNENLDPELRREYVKTIIGAAQKLSSLVSNILKLNKLENQEIMPRAERFDLSEQLRQCVLAHEDLWEKKGLGLDVDLPEEPTMVLYDASILEIVWNNLLSNAIKFTPEGGKVSLSQRNDKCWTWVTITDSGCGMDEPTLRRVFDKFYQGDSSHSGEGNGLGLALAKRVLDLCAGEISVASQPGQGASFCVRLKTCA